VFIIRTVRVEDQVRLRAVATCVDAWQAAAGLVMILHSHGDWRRPVAEVLVQFTDPVVSPEKRLFVARACGAEMADGLWEGWIEFIPADGGPAQRTRRETTQPKREDAVYWATGLTPVYLEGALERAQRPARQAAPCIPPPVFDGPADDMTAPPAPESILNPFSVYRKGEALLRNQLGALSPWHLVNIIRAHGLSDLDPATLNRLDTTALIETIVTAVRRRVPAPTA
jgi:hypothetical protein